MAVYLKSLVVIVHSNNGIKMPRECNTGKFFLIAQCWFPAWALNGSVQNFRAPKGWM